MEFACQLDSPLGPIVLTEEDGALRSLRFVGQRYFPDSLPPFVDPATRPVFEETADWLARYFSGHEPEFTPPLAPQGTPFRLAVWELLALAAICLFFALAALLWLCARDRRRGAAAVCLLLLPASYALMQCFLGLENAPSSRGAVHRFFHECFLRLPPRALIALIAGLSLEEIHRMKPGAVLDLFIYRRRYDDVMHWITREE